MTIQVTNDERSMMRAALLKAGIKTRGLDDDQLSAKYLDNGNQAKPAPAKPKAPKKTNGKKPPVDASAIDDVIRINPKPVTDVGKAIQDLIDASTTDAKLDEKRVLELIAEHSNAPQVFEHQVVITKGKTSKTIKGAHPALADVIDVLSVGENVYMVGGAGVGKTHLASMAAEAMGTKLYATGAVLDKHELIGFVDANGKYHKTPFYDVLKNGGLFLWDEVDSSLPSALNYFNAVLENGFITFPNNEYVEVDRAKTFFLCAANTVGTGANRSYVGRFELDRAFLDRFSQIEMDYDRGIELSMARSAWIEAGGDTDQLSIAESWAVEVMTFRQLLADRKILAIVSTRATRRGARFLAKGWDSDKVKKAELYRHLSHDQKKQLNIEDV